MIYIAILLTVATLSYLIGATPFGFLAGRLQGIDIREHGSGNIGATNVLRTLGKPTGIAVFILDFLKGFGPVFLTVKTMGNLGTWTSELAPLCSAIGTILGHNFTFWLRFKGGKGIATSAGALLALMPEAVLAGMITWILLFVTTRYVAIASMGAALMIPVAVLARGIIRPDAIEWPDLSLAGLIAVLAVVRHRTNISRLLQGSEHRFERKKKESGGGG